MNFILKPWQLLLLILAGWINRHQQDAIEYLLTAASIRSSGEGVAPTISMRRVFRCITTKM